MITAEVRRAEGGSSRPGVESPVSVTTQPASEAPPYVMLEGRIVDGKLQFESEAAFKEAITIGFFKIRVPKGMNLEAGRKFAREFTQDSYYRGFGQLNVGCRGT